ncbi:unnamed protein product [Adineta steineri]|uniref:G-protein coupled receptors family 1 profile domain-containing protein n=1 Tax=Adineta steineri TaxID=433720 RepID=A0A813Y213_9BILA|nr:unnamed protein product [Adineta steineri]CAF3694158.1 unnamed protein product [Adineta steineri]
MARRYNRLVRIQPSGLGSPCAEQVPMEKPDPNRGWPQRAISLWDIKIKIKTSIGSLLFINTGLWTIIIRILTGIDYMNRSLFWCKTNAWLTYSGGCFSFMCNCFAGFCQFLILLPNTEWQRLITRTRAKLIIIFTAIIYLLIFIPIPIYNTNFQPSSATYVCKSSLQIINVYSNYWIIIGYYFMPALLTLLLFTLIWYNFQQFLRRRHCIEGVVTHMMLIQMSSILISGIPAGIFVCYIMVTQSMVKTRVRLSYEFLILVILTLFTFLTNGTSFWIYLFCSKTFRKHLKEFIFKFKFFNHRIQPISLVDNNNKNIPMN